MIYIIHSVLSKKQIQKEQEQTKQKPTKDELRIQEINNTINALEYQIQFKQQRLTPLTVQEALIENIKQQNFTTQDEAQNEANEKNRAEQRILEEQQYIKRLAKQIENLEMEKENIYKKISQEETKKNMSNQLSKCFLPTNNPNKDPFKKDDNSNCLKIDDNSNCLKRDDNSTSTTMDDARKDFTKRFAELSLDTATPTTQIATLPPIQQNIEALLPPLFPPNGQNAEELQNSPEEPQDNHNQNQ